MLGGAGGYTSLACEELQDCVGDKCVIRKGQFTMLNVPRKSKLNVSEKKWDRRQWL